MSLKKLTVLFLLLAVLTAFWFWRKTLFAVLDRFRNPEQSLTELRLENEGLRRELAGLQNRLQIPVSSFVRAAVFSRYPFNNEQNIVISIGSRAGAKIGLPVLAGENYLLGRIVRVKADASEVQTIFSPEWRSAVRIGKNGPEAILSGGRPPVLDFIPADAEIRTNEEIFSASPDLPPNLFIGRVVQTISQPQNSFRQAKIKTDYDFNQIREILLNLDYEGFN